MQSLRTLLCDSIDYAGLFPPASLPMEPAVRNYAAYHAGEHAWALGRFVLPVARLGEFEAAVEAFVPRQPNTQPWCLSVLGGAAPDANIRAIQAFNDRHSSGGTARSAMIDTLELKAASPAEIEQAARRIPSSLTPYVEIPIGDDPHDLIAALADTGARAKVRTGGVTPDMFPGAQDLLRFMQTCIAAKVPFKATAGLHHPLRGNYRLTYEHNSATGTMYGFLNVFLAAALLDAGMAGDEAMEVLTETSRDAFRFDDACISWRTYRLHNNQLAHMRQQVAIAFGSCSFEEPIRDLKALDVL